MTGLFRPPLNCRYSTGAEFGIRSSSTHAEVKTVRNSKIVREKKMLYAYSKKKVGAFRYLKK